MHQRVYRQLGGEYGKFMSDSIKCKVKSVKGNLWAQIFTNTCNYTVVYPMISKAHAHETLDMFIHEIGVPQKIHTDGALELCKGNWGKIFVKHHIKQSETELYSPWQNHAERAVAIIRRKARLMMQSTQTPIRLWDYAYMYDSELRSLTVTDHYILQG